MPKFYMDWGGTWISDDFTRGYIEAMFFTENAPGVTAQRWEDNPEGEFEGSIPCDAGADDLTLECLRKIIADCTKFKSNFDLGEILVTLGREEEAGRDFWYTRNGHGVGFSDGDWPEPWADRLDRAANKFGAFDIYFAGGKIHH